jgi:hypothetical protein
MAQKLHLFVLPVSHCHAHECSHSLTCRTGPGQAHIRLCRAFASAQLVVSYCCHKFGVLDFGFNLAQSCSTCSRAAGSPSLPVQHDGGRASILLRLLRWRMASSLQIARARKVVDVKLLVDTDSGAHEKSRDHLHNLQQAPSDARHGVASVAPARKGRAQGQLVSNRLFTYVAEVTDVALVFPSVIPCGKNCMNQQN